MDNVLIANYLRKIASEIESSEIVSIEFNTQAELDAYLKEHPEADRSKHSIKTIVE